MKYPGPIQKLIDEFSKFPSVGPRTASRFVFFLLKRNSTDNKRLIGAIRNLKKEIKTCSFCFNPFDATKDENENLCEICRKPNRDKTKLCVVEKEADLLSIEETNEYKGIYFILGGTVPSIKTDKGNRIRDRELTKRIKNPEKFGFKSASFEEIIIATNPTTEGEATALHLEKILKDLDIKITRLGRGMPTGGELEYADRETLSSALKSRK